MTQRQNEIWSNWSGSQQSSPTLFFPHDLDSLKEVVQSYPKIRVVGAGHSFSPLVKTNDVMISLEQYKGMVTHDAEHYQSEFYAGTRLYDVGEKLAAVNQALMNQGDINQQSIAGAIATATHGTGIELPCLSALVSGFELLTASGDVLQCDAAQHANIFHAGRVALGSFGVMTKIQLQNRPMYRLKEQIRLCPLQDIFQHMEQWKTEHRHIEFFAFIHAQDVVLKTLDETFDSIQERPQSWIDEDLILNLCSELNRICPKVNPLLQKLLNLVIRQSTVVDWSTRLFPSERHTRFNEMEYQIPAEHGLACFEEVMHVLKKQRAHVFFPIEFRYVRADDIWLSPFYQQDAVSISVHQFYKQNYELIFNLVEPIFLKYRGRPHWGKLHSLEARQLQKLYPKWDDFMRLRHELDPTQKWLNSYLERIFLT